MKFERVVILLAALATVAATARLGWWQLDRAAQKIALQVAIETRRELPPLAGAELALDGAQAAVQHHRRVELRGRWLAASTVFLDNRQMKGRPGFLVLTPMVLGDGGAVVVQRGWLPREFLERTRVAAPALPEGEVTLVARIAPPPSRLYDLGADGAGAIRQNLDLAAFAAELGRPLRPLSLLMLAPSAGTAPDTLQRDWPQPAADVHKHYGYAFQWFALAVLTIALYLWFQLIRPRRVRTPA